MVLFLVSFSICKRAQRLGQIDVAESHVDFGIYLLRVGFQSCGLGFHDILGGHDTLAVAQLGVTQIVVGL